MCLQDLKLGRLKYNKVTSGVFSSASGVAITLTPNPNRVAVTFFADGNDEWLLSIAPYNSATLIGVIRTTPIPITFRVEDYGQLVQGGFAFLQAAGSASVAGCVETLLKQSNEQLERALE